MSSIVVRTVDDIQAYEGPGAITGVRFKAAREALGVSAWGMNVIELDPNTDTYPEHDHTADGQEEVYVVLSGQVTLQTADANHDLPAGAMARVPSTTRRKLVTGEQGAVVLALGGTPGQAYTPGMGG